MKHFYFIDKFLKEKKYPTVYVLMRLYCSDIKNCNTFFSDLRNKSLQSVLKNKYKYRHLVLLVNDDTKQIPGNEYLNYTKERDDLFNELFGEKGWLLTEHGGGEGSSLAMYNLHELFIHTAQSDNDIAVTLDQDDKLTGQAIRNIAKRMVSNGIIICPYKMIDKGNLDITDDGGVIHNALAKKLAIRGEMSDYYNEIADLSSIGWTKAYTKSILKEYIGNLNIFLNDKHGGAINFFKQYTAYEDFLDFYALLLRNSTICGLRAPTHIYFKNDSSITANPSVSAFSETRPVLLLTLVDLCFATQDSLREDFKPNLLRYVASKTCQIENILAKYNLNFTDKGMLNYSDFSILTPKGFFLKTLCRMAEESRLKSFEELVSESIYSIVPQYKRVIQTTKTLDVLFDAVNEEITIREDKKRQQKGRKLFFRRMTLFHKTEGDDDIVTKLMADYQPPHQKSYIRFRNGGWLVFGFILLFLVFFLFLPQFEVNLCGKSWVKGTYTPSIEAIVGIFSLLITLFTFWQNELYKQKIAVGSEFASTKLYYSEFHDFERHLEANIKILVQIKKELDDHGLGIVQDIHFNNLIWPESSCLFSDEMAKIIARNRVDDFARLKVNIRNVNNSARWLSRQRHDTKHFKDALEWEITRYFGYLVNVYYMENNGFHFPNQNELEIYIHENSIKNKLTTLFMDYSSYEERITEVESYIGRYYSDRRERRSVLII